MPALARGGERPGYEACSGCALCLLPCPVWWQTRDPMLTLMGRARALQGGASAEAVAGSLEACVLCGACEPICPEQIDTMGMTLALRARLAARGALPLAERARTVLPGLVPTTPERGVTAQTLLLEGPGLAADPAVSRAVLRHMGKAAEAASDDGRDLALALEVGLSADPDRERRFLSGLRSARRLVVSEGLLHRFLRERLPGVTVVGVGEALLAARAVRAALGPTDLLVLETRGYHADFERLVRFYDHVRRETGCLTNLDLQRIATPTGATSAQARLRADGEGGAGGTADVDRGELARWIGEGRAPARVVLESLDDRAPFAEALGVPVVHLAELA